MPEPEDIFKDYINSLNLPLSDKGLAAPDIEQINKNNINGDVLKITYDLILFLNHEEPRYFMVTSNQKMQNIGRMSLKEAILKFSKLPRRKKS